MIPADAQVVSLVPALGWTLVHSLWQGAAVALLLVIANGFIPRTASNVRYVAACIALVLMLALPLGTFFTVRDASAPADSNRAALVAKAGGGTASSASHEDGGAEATDGPPSEHAGHAHAGHRDASHGGSHEHDAACADCVLHSQPDPAFTWRSGGEVIDISDRIAATVRAAAKREALESQDQPGAAVASDVAGDEPADPNGGFWFESSSSLRLASPVVSSALIAVGKSLQDSLAGRLSFWVPWLVVAWSLGVIVLSLRLLGGWVFAQKIRRSGIDQPIASLQRTADRLARDIGVSKPVRVCKSLLVEVPTVIGWLRPVILMPASTLTGLSPKQLESLLAHELAHVRRYDYLINMVQTVVETLLFYHPAVWWVSHCIRAERENACDDIAVQACGDRVVYARALCELEQLRAAGPELALSAKGGSLMDRIQRLIGAPARSAQASRWVAGIVTMTAMLFVAQSFVGPEGVGVQQVTAASTYTAKWRAEASKWSPDGIRLTIERREGRHSRWSSTNQVAIDDLAGLTMDDVESGSADVQFAINRDAGRLTFEGHFRNGQGMGTCEFTASSDYLSDLRRMGYRPDDDEIFVLFTQDVSRRYIEELAQLGYDDLKLDRLIAFAIHDVSPKFIRGMRDAGYTNIPGDKLVAMRIHDVDPEYVRGMAEAGYTDISGDKLVAMRIHDVDPEFVKAMADAGYKNLSQDKLVAMRIHDVDPEFVRAMSEAGYTDISADKLVQMRIHDVDPEFVRAMAEAGYDDLSTDKLVQMRIHDVDPHFVRSMVESGHKDLSADKLVQMRIHDVDPSFVRALEDAGYTDISQDKLVQMRIHDVSPSFIREMARLGYTDVPADKLVAMRIHDVDPKFVRAMDDLGYKDIPVDKLVAMRIHDVSHTFVHEMDKLGYSRLPVDKLVAMRIHDVSASFVRELKSLGYGDVSTDKLVAMRIHDVTPSFIRRAHKRYGMDVTVDDLIEMRIHGGRWDDI